MRRFLLSAFLLAGVVTPAFASAADHEPARGALLLGLIFVAALSWVLACRRWWLPLVAWTPLALGAAVYVAHLIDPAVSAAIREEIGADYLLEADLFAALAIVAPLMIVQSRLNRFGE
ncbi:hypothetical protein [Ancylobacter terrae]|uniref:hypothetical protein n=1 Tax=Ancylobacter sp. sgz301288 TaxID=3342077 RepID=UPI003859945C